MKGFVNFVGGVALGVLIGASAALLSTPYSGEEARNRLMSKSREFRNSAQQRMEQGQNVVQERLTTINQKIADSLEAGSEMLRDAANRMRQSQLASSEENIKG